MPRLPRPLSVIALGLILVGALLLVVGLGRRGLTETLIAAVEAETGRVLSVPGDLGISLLPHPGLFIEGVSLAGPPDFGDAPLIRVARAEVAVRPWALLRGRLEPAKIRLSGVRIDLVRGPDGRGNWAPIIEPAADPVPPAPSAPASVPTPAAPDGAGAPSVARLADPDGAAPGGRGGLAGLRLDGIEVTDATLTWGDRGSGRRLALRDLRLTTGPLAPGAALGLHLSAGLGQAGEGGDTRIGASATLDQWEGGALAVSEILVHVSGLPPTDGFDGPLELTGSLGVQAGAPIRFDLALTGLDLDPFLSPMGTPAGPDPALAPALAQPGPAGPPIGTDPAPAQPGSAYPSRPVSPSNPPPPAEGALLATELPPNLAPNLAPSPDLDGHLSVGHLRIAGLDLHGVEVQVLAEGGELRLDHRVAGFYGGSLAGTLRLDGRGSEPRIALETVALGFQAGPLLADLTGASTGAGSLAGRGDLGVSLATAGSDRAALIRALQGSLALRLKEGALVGIDLGALIEGAGAPVEGRPAPNQTPGAAPRTVFDELTASSVLADGILRSDDLAAHGPLLRTTGSGTLDLADGRLDWRLTQVLVKRPKGRWLRELEGVPILVLVSGTLAAPVWRVDVASALREVARRKLHERGEGLLENIERRTGIRGLDGVLRGLLGR